MKRLTRRDEDGHAVMNCEQCDCREGHCTALGCRNQLKDRLSYYEDLEQQGLLVRLPCKVGDTVYVIDGNSVRRGKVKSISITTEVVIRGTYNHFGLVDFAGEFGNSVFPTREEAETAIKGAPHA